MRKQICSLALSALFGLGVAIAAPQAQDQAPPQSTPETGQNGGHRDGAHGQFDPNRQVQMLSKRLSLTGDQQNQILSILTNRRQQMESLRSDNSLAPKDRRAKMRSIRDDSDAQIRALLSDTQKQTFDNLQQQMRDREQQRREQRHNGGDGAGKL
jgi:protein CpxP